MADWSKTSKLTEGKEEIAENHLDRVVFCRTDNDSALCLLNGSLFSTSQLF